MSLWLVLLLLLLRRSGSGASSWPISSAAAAAAVSGHWRASETNWRTSSSLRGSDAMCGRSTKWMPRVASHSIGGSAPMTTKAASFG